MAYKPPGFNMEPWSIGYPPIDAPPSYGQVQPPYPAGGGEDLSATVARQRIINKNTFVNVAAVPTEQPPYGSTPLILPSGPVMLSSMTTDANAALGSTAVATAVGRYSAITTVIPAATGEYQNILTYTVRTGTKVVIRGLGAWSHDYLAQHCSAILWQISVGGRTYFTAPMNLGSVSGPDNPAPTFILASENQVIQVQAMNRDLRSGTLVEACIFGWELMVSQNDDSLQSLIPNQTIDSNGRFSFGLGSCGTSPFNGPSPCP